MRQRIVSWNISTKTVERTLAELVKQGIIKKSEQVQQRLTFGFRNSPENLSSMDDIPREDRS